MVGIDGQFARTLDVTFLVTDTEIYCSLVFGRCLAYKSGYVHNCHFMRLIISRFMSSSMVRYRANARLLGA